MEDQASGLLQQLKAELAALRQRYMDLLSALQQQQSAFDAIMKAMHEKQEALLQQQQAGHEAAMAELKELKELITSRAQAPGSTPAPAGCPCPSTAHQAQGCSHQVLAHAGVSKMPAQGLSKKVTLPTPTAHKREATETSEGVTPPEGSSMASEVPPSKRARRVEPTQGGTPAIAAADDEVAGSGPGLPDAATTPAPAAAPTPTPAPAAPPQQSTQPGPGSCTATGQQGGPGARQAGPLAQDSSRPEQQFSPAELQDFRYQAGQTLLLQGQHKDASSGAFTQTGVQLQLQVGAARGFGATGEVYDVKVLQHDFPASTETAAAAPQSLVGQKLCLKVCRFFCCVPDCLRTSMYEGAEDFLGEMRASLFKHHTIMQECGGRLRTVIGSYVFGSICGAEGLQAVSALLMDRAEMGSVAQQLMQRPRTRPGLGWRQAHAVVSEVVFGMADMHDAGWAHLDIKPANIVISRHIGEEGAFSHHSLIDFGSSVWLGTLDDQILDVPGTHEVISPEWRNNNVVGYKADIWAVGVLLLELRAGRALSDKLLQGLMQQSSHASTLAAMRQSAVYSHLTPDEWACVTACLTYEHTERPDVDELLTMPYLKHWQ